MKLTESMLKQIVKEELRKHLNEVEPAQAQAATSAKAPDAYTLYRNLQERNPIFFKKQIYDTIAEVKAKIIKRLEIEKNEHKDIIGYIKRLVDTFDNPYRKEGPPDEQIFNKAIIFYFNDKNPLLGIGDLIDDTLKHMRVYAGPYHDQDLIDKYEPQVINFILNNLFEQIKNDTAVKQAVQKARQQIESGSVPTQAKTK